MAGYPPRDLSIEEALHMYIKYTLAHNNQLYVLLYSLSEEGGNKTKVKLAITHYMGRKKGSSGRRYDSSSGNEFIIGGIYKEVIGVILYSKAFLKCDAADKRVEEAE